MVRESGFSVWDTVNRYFFFAGFFAAVFFAVAFLAGPHGPFDLHAIRYHPLFFPY